MRLKVRRHLKEMAEAAKALARKIASLTYAEDLLSEHPLEAEQVAREVEEAAGELRGLASRLYALEARLKAPYGQRSYLADNSAKALKELLGDL